MNKLLFLVGIASSIIYGQILFDPIYNLSNTPSATSDYHSVYHVYNDFYVVWGDNSQVLLKTSSNSGETWSSNKVVTSDGSYPVMAAQGNNIAVVYHDLNTGVFFQKSTDGGNTWLPSPTLMSTHSSGQTPQLSYDNIQRLYAVWEERPGSNYELMFSRSTNFGNTWSTPVNISNTSTTSRWVQIEANANNVFCAWVETSTYPFSDIYFIKSTDAGISWSTPVNITNDSRPQNRIDMEVSWDNKIYLVCDDISSYPVFNFDDIYLLKSTDAGISWLAAENITNNPGHSHTPSIKLIDNAIYFTWSDNTQSAPAYDNSDIYFKWSPDGGITWQDSTKICSNPENSYKPQLCWGIDGPIPAPWYELSIIWYDYSTGDAEILARNGIQNIPVELTSFTAEPAGNSVKLFWATATEKNNQGFEVKRKLNNSDIWITAAFIEGKGTTAEPQNYYYEDNGLSPSKYFYRLKQIDFDGSFIFSDEIEVDLVLPLQARLSQNYPNPFNPSTKITYQVAEPCNVTLNVFDLLGTKITELVNEFKQPGIYSSEFSAAELTSGIYFYTIQAGSFTSTRKMLLIK